jgi:hypothetical protein
VAAGSSPIALAQQKFDFWLWRGNLFDDDSGGIAGCGLGSSPDGEQTQVCNKILLLLDDGH